MCTVMWFQRGTRRVFAANRDERIDRPAGPPILHRAGPRQVLAPTDLQAGGTWIGVNDAGLLAAVTNRFGSTSATDRSGLTSRGTLVFRALQAETAQGAVQALDLDPADFNGFHLVLSDPTEAIVLCNDGERVHQEARADGVHLVTERSFMSSRSPREDWLRRRLEHAEPGRAWIPLLTECRLDAPFDGPFVHVPERGYGTRSTTYVEFGPPMTFLHRDWLPNPSEFRDYSRGFETSS